VTSSKVACSEAIGPCAAASVRLPQPAPVTITAITRRASRRPYDVLPIRVLLLDRFYSHELGSAAADRQTGAAIPTIR
jgi:hypothetical protein